MGKYDAVIFRYLSEPFRFADLFNAAVFQGDEVVRGDMLENDSERYVSVEHKANTVWSKSRFRDLKKRMKNGNWLAITAIENQELVDYAMPIRMMEYDLLEYEEQVRHLQGRKRETLAERGIKENAWNVRMNAEDKLTPVYSLCFYHGDEEWKGPKSLKDMMNFEGASQKWQEFFQDYGMKLFCVNEIRDFSIFKTGLRQLLQVLPYRKNKKKIWELWERDEYKHLDRDTAEAIAIMTDATTVLERLDEYKTEGGYNMCQAMDELRQDWFAEGEERGIEDSIRNLMISMKWTAEQAMDALLVPAEERAGYLTRLSC